MKPQIFGTTMPVLEFTLSAGESVVSESGRMSWMSPDIAMATDTAATGGGKGGILGKIKRVAGGGTLFASSFTAQSAGAVVAFATTVPGEILPVAVDANTNYMVHRHGFLAATPGIELTVGFQQKLGAGLFGGEGFVLQQLSGQAQAWVQLQGEVVSYELAAGQTMLVHPGHVGMFTAGMPFTIATVKGIKNKIFGDEIFLCQISGPGQLWLQSLTLPGLAGDLAPYLPQPSSGNNSGPSFSFNS